MNELQENSRVLRNQLYDRAVQLATYTRTLTGRGHYDASASVTSLCLRHAWGDRSREMFNADEVGACHAGLIELERRLGGEDRLVRRVDPLDRATTDDHIRAVYHALVDVLSTAADRGLGFLWAVRHDGAEEALAEKIREREEQWRRHEEEWRDRPKQSMDEVRAELRALKRRMAEKYGRPGDADDC